MILWKKDWKFEKNCDSFRPSLEDLFSRSRDFKSHHFEFIMKWIDKKRCLIEENVYSFDWVQWSSFRFAIRMTLYGNVNCWQYPRRRQHGMDYLNLLRTRNLLFWTLILLVRITIEIIKWKSINSFEVGVWFWACKAYDSLDVWWPMVILFFLGSQVISVTFGSF